MTWRALAIFSWTLAASLALWIVQQGIQPTITGVAVADAVPPLLLVAPGQLPAQSAAEPADEAMAQMLSEQACVRLGKFPTRPWAQRVADVLTLAPAGQATAADFRLRGADDSGYFIVFPAWTLDQLSRRLAERAEGLKRWVSASARPERCQPAER